jgi:hypothetical protein
VWPSAACIPPFPRGAAALPRAGPARHQLCILLPFQLTRIDTIKQPCCKSHITPHHPRGLMRQVGEWWAVGEVTSAITFLQTMRRAGGFATFMPAL